MKWGKKMTRIVKAIGKHFREKHPYYICVIITLGLLALGVFRFPNAIGRLVESCRDLGLSVAYAFCDLCGIEAGITPTVNELPDYSFLNLQDLLHSFIQEPSVPSSRPSTTLPTEWERFKGAWRRYWETFVDKSCFLMYLILLLDIFNVLVSVVMGGIPLALIVKKLFDKYYFREKKSKRLDCEETPNETITESKPLRAWHWLYFHVLLHIGLWFVRLFNFIKERETLWQFWLLLALLYFNVFTIFFEFCAYYLYFAISFDLINLYRQLYKLCLDLYPFLSFAGVVSWIVVIILLLKKKSENLKYYTLMNEEAE